MDTTDLARAIRDHARSLREVGDQIRLDDHVELLRVLAHIVEGMPIVRAFGVPGDWGYETPIGKALAKVTRKP